MKVYINCPGNAETGGIEALIQLCDAINNLGGEGIMLWGPRYNGEFEPWVHAKYKNYKIKESSTVEDIPENIIVYPEAWSEKINTYKNIKKCIWWLSADNNENKFNDFSNPEIIHFYQSNYALDYLKRNGAIKYLPLYDYLSEKYVIESENLCAKEDIVCFNPSKGYDITSQIILKNPDLRFFPLSNMSENDVISLLKRSKVYIDFGHHPGKDRFPRESAILKNCVITNTRGSSDFYNDVPLDPSYKTDNIELVGPLIRDCLQNFDTHLNNFSMYRSIIKNEKDEFYNQCKRYFIYVNKQDSIKSIGGRIIFRYRSN
jgi:hypothetical protein